MKAINDNTILERAKFFCDQNGTTWDRLSDYNHRRYLARAREQMLDEDASQLISRGLFRDPQSGGIAVFSLAETVTSETFPRLIEPYRMVEAAD